ncbi:MAG: hypothetical protein LBF58_01955 [Deltaproteobacteria bacterium]|jgi:hypothetical protein|nr:hypothetical protein [Deltaproteobacteria bacterium]
MDTPFEKPRLPAALSTLAIGSVPYADPGTALDLMAENLDIPASPQMVRVSPHEDMILGAVHGLPALAVDPDLNVRVDPGAVEEALARFYGTYLTGDLAPFALGEESSLGFEAFIERAGADPSFGRRYLKSQVVGPLTFGQAVKIPGGKSLVDNPDLLEAVSTAIGAKAAWLALRIRATGRAPLIFIDEPGLTGYGSAFSTLSPQMVIDSLGTAVRVAQERGGALVGCHVCGNTDWGLLSRVGLDVLNFDAHAYLGTVCLYPREMGAFLEGGGALAFGVVPTNAEGPPEGPGALAAMVREGWANLSSKGVDPVLLAERTYVTSSCGLGSLDPGRATAILGTIPRVARLLKG